VPELPEVETIVRGLSDLAGSRIKRVEVHDRRLRLPEEKLVGRVLSRIERKGKYVVCRLSDGASLLLHLRMSGRLVRFPSPQERQYTRLCLHFDRGRVHFVDPRRLGTAQYSSDGFVADLGIDPTERTFTKRRLATIVSASRAPIKVLLMDQRKIAGIGNIYAAEALFEARIDPRRLGGSLSEEEVAAAHAGVRSVLTEAIRHLGTTLGEGVCDYRQTSGESGSFQEHLHVYSREGEACHRCGTPVERIKQGGRSTYFCPGCQH
jgi:formamidopyrimidine-DNA glycosylase